MAYFQGLLLLVSGIGGFDLEGTIFAGSPSIDDRGAYGAQVATISTIVARLLSAASAAERKVWGLFGGEKTTVMLRMLGTGTTSFFPGLKGGVG